MSILTVFSILDILCHGIACSAFGGVKEEESGSITDLVTSPDSHFVAMLDSFGRIWIWSVLQCRFSRILKGYRRAQIAWCSVNEDVDKLDRARNGTMSDSVIRSVSPRGGRSLDVHHLVSSSTEAASDDPAASDYSDHAASSSPNEDDGVPLYLRRRSVSVFVVYLESRGQLEFHSLSTLKRVHAVKVPRNGQLIQSMHFAVCPPTATVLLSVPSESTHSPRSGTLRKIYRLKVAPDLLRHSERRSMSRDRRGTDCWVQPSFRNLVFRSEFEFVFDGKSSDRLSVFGRERVRCDNGASVSQWFVAVVKCDGDVCIGLQCIDGKEGVQPLDAEDGGDFCDVVSGWGYHCDGFMKHRASFSRFGWKYGERDTVTVILAVSDKGSVLQFALNGTMCPQPAVAMPRGGGSYRLAVSVGLNSFAQLLLVGFSKS